MTEKRVKGWWLIRLALTIVGKKGLKELNKASKKGRESSAAALRSILTAAKDTVYGREHHFDEILEAKTPGGGGGFIQPIPEECPDQRLRGLAALCGTA
jgi:hypothetical protein